MKRPTTTWYLWWTAALFVLLWGSLAPGCFRELPPLKGVPCNNTPECTGVLECIDAICQLPETQEASQESTPTEPIPEPTPEPNAESAPDSGN